MIGWVVGGLGGWVGDRMGGCKTGARVFLVCFPFLLFFSRVRTVVTCAIRSIPRFLPLRFLYIAFMAKALRCLRASFSTVYTAYTRTYVPAR